ncbi:uncharacterized protein BDZ99DRAFT_520768 [Mytilinidion resinicola]|uniref:Uncharacterized protein n=1 Tax=Mytilinidion resinicola TaxID=574789 RepID=A0A6A6YLH3_9PEZI|nr:uncharacterized protein BDZ99DRAFT_520768 [Mytilinidion resinicola]KAF2809413.1 hypothetical protein BDZ99DRAFT_520768 [Mytilinidion resinicola]
MSQSPGGTKQLEELKRKHAYDPNNVLRAKTALDRNTLVSDPAYKISKELNSFKILSERDYHCITTEKLISLAIFKTSNELLGMAFHTIRPGDIIALLSGGAMPYILRPEGENYRFIATAAISRLMGGEEWPEIEADLMNFTLI